MKTSHHWFVSLLIGLFALATFQVSSLASQQILISANEDINTLLEQGKQYMNQDQLKKYTKREPSNIENDAEPSKTTGQSQVREKPETKQTDALTKSIKKQSKKWFNKK